MNPLQRWETKHRKDILDSLNDAGLKLTLENVNRIIEETSFRVRSKKHPTKCPYYAIGRPCHPEVEDLNCFLCACPNFESDKITGGCRINSAGGKFYHHSALPEGKVWDCTGCSINHSPEEVRKYLIGHILA